MADNTLDNSVYIEKVAKIKYLNLKKKNQKRN